MSKRSRSCCASVIDPELGADIVTLGMVPSVDVTDDGVVTVGVKLTIGGCPLRAQIKKDVETRVAVHPGVTKVKIDWGEMTSEERSDGHAQGALERTRERAEHRSSCIDADPGDRQRQGWSRQIVGHRQPRRGDRCRRVHRRCARRRHLGLLGAASARHRRPARGRDRRGPRQADDHPADVARGARGVEGRQHGISRRGRHGLDVAGADAQQGSRAVPARCALGRPRLPVHRHAAGNRRRADGSWRGCCRAPIC